MQKALFAVSFRCLLAVSRQKTSFSESVFITMLSTFANVPNSGLHAVRGHLQTDFVTLNDVKGGEGLAPWRYKFHSASYSLWTVRNCTSTRKKSVCSSKLLELHIFKVITHAFYLYTQDIKFLPWRLGGGGGSGLNVIMTLSVAKSVWRCPLILALY